MMLGDDFDARISDWLADGPVEAPRQPIAAAVAHARAHPRRRLAGVRVGPAVHGRGGIAVSRRRPLFAVAGIATAAAAAIVLLFATGASSPTRLPSGPELPVVGPVTSATPDTTPVPSGPRIGSDLAGTWSGTVVEAAPVDPTTDYQRDPSKDTTWSMTLDLHACIRGETCGSLAKATKSIGGTGKALDCSATVSFGGRSQDGTTYVFDEKGAEAGCDLARISVTPSADGASVTVEESTTGNTLDRGTLDRIAASSAPASTAAQVAATADPRAAVDAIAGTWTGTLYEPATAIDPLSNIPYKTDKAVMFDATVDLQACAVGAGCGTLRRSTSLWPPTDQPFACSFDLTFRGFYQGSAALLFDEKPAASQPSGCTITQMIVTPLTSGQAVAVEETTSGLGTFDHGVLMRSPITTGANPAPTPAPVMPADAVRTVADVAGTWTGTLIVPPFFSSDGSAYPAAHGHTEFPDVTWDTTVVIGACELGTDCGTLEEATDLWPLTGRPLTCRFDITFLGSYPGSSALVFEAAAAGTQPSGCTPPRMLVTPLASGQAIAVEAFTDATTFDHGVLLKNATP